MSTGTRPATAGEVAQLPSTVSLKAFEAVARHGSISAAANELCLTQSAVSKQVQALEAMLGVALFARSNRGLSLTAEGLAYLPFVREAFERLVAGARAMPARRRALRLHVVPVVGERWLMPRFPRFQAAHPKIDVRFPYFATNMDAGDADAMIRFGNGQWPDRAVDYLFGRELHLVGAPALVQRVLAGDLSMITFLEHHQAGCGWADLECVELLPARAQVLSFGFYALIIRAAVSGQGLALLPTCLIEEELERGDLLRCGGISRLSPHGYWLTHAKGREADGDFLALKDWIVREAAQASELEL
ncbi:MAG: LysR family transcriptional regulator [Beijerinckiaceae bacterium]|nr:LysR family transcriptional regulator [Beijerinckiaceae bacterium]